MTKEQLLNFDIESIWKEMEVINRSKRAAQTLMSSFQELEKSQERRREISPTKRLINMKNAAANENNETKKKLFHEE